MKGDVWLLMLDELTTLLDTIRKEELLNLIANTDISQIIMVTHDEDFEKGNIIKVVKRNGMSGMDRTSSC